VEARRGGLEAEGAALDRGVRYGLYYDRPRELFVNVTLCWSLPKGQNRREPHWARGTHVAMPLGHDLEGYREQRRLVVPAAGLARAILALLTSFDEAGSVRFKSGKV
jgi:hypothetical protein